MESWLKVQFLFRLLLRQQPEVWPSMGQGVDGADLEGVDELGGKAMKRTPKGRLYERYSP